MGTENVKGESKTTIPWMIEVEQDLVLHDQSLLRVKVKDSAGLEITKGVKNATPLDNGNILGFASDKLNAAKET